ncbi:MAG: hypothetical protein IJD69_03840 [Alphaproteobacteria bacterium]|nr:hypothetical protein [Alphaproteobacteria bacterium]MBR5566793.1 hypothetical protein [Alphaproteobacteria bacterium]
MQNRKNQSNVGQMIQRCHKWRQKRKQYIDQARQTADEIERERLLQAAEHYGRMVNTEQGKIDSTRDPKEKAAAEKAAAEQAAAESQESGEDEDAGFPDFITNLK